MPSIAASAIISLSLTQPFGLALLPRRNVAWLVTRRFAPATQRVTAQLLVRWHSPANRLHRRCRLDRAFRLPKPLALALLPALGVFGIIFAASRWMMQSVCHSRARERTPSRRIEPVVEAIAAFLPYRFGGSCGCRYRVRVRRLADYARRALAWRCSLHIASARLRSVLSDCRSEFVAEISRWPFRMRLASLRPKSRSRKSRCRKVPDHFSRRNRVRVWLAPCPACAVSIRTSHACNAATLPVMKVTRNAKCGCGCGLG